MHVSVSLEQSTCPRLVVPFRRMHNIVTLALFYHRCPQPGFGEHVISEVIVSIETSSVTEARKCPPAQKISCIAKSQSNPRHVYGPLPQGGGVLHR